MRNSAARFQASYMKLFIRRVVVLRPESQMLNCYYYWDAIDGGPASTMACTLFVASENATSREKINSMNRFDCSSRREQQKRHAARTMSDSFVAMRDGKSILFVSTSPVSFRVRNMLWSIENRDFYRVVKAELVCLFTEESNEAETRRHDTSDTVLTTLLSCCSSHENIQLNAF